VQPKKKVCNTFVFSDPNMFWNFDDYWHCFMLLFKLLCGDWMENMMDCIDANGLICVPYFITAVVLIDYVLLNLLLAIFLNRFSTATLIENGNQNVQENKITAAFLRFKRAWNCFKCLFAHFSSSNPGTANAIEDRNVEPEIRNETSIKSWKTKVFEKLQLQQKCLNLMKHQLFQPFYTGLTLLLAVQISLDDANLSTRPCLMEFMKHSDHLIFLCLVVEAAVKIIALGFPKYIKWKWNRLDLIILFGLTFNYFSENLDIGRNFNIKPIRVFRIFSAFKGIRLLFNALGEAMSKIVGVLGFCLILWLLFANMGVQLFKGKFFTCWDEGFTVQQFFPSKDDCTANNYTVLNTMPHFDNVFGAYLCVLQIITFNGWNPILYKAVNSRESVEKSFNEKVYLLCGYLIIIILVGSFFAFNLFTGVIIDGLNAEKAKIDLKTQSMVDIQTKGLINVRKRILHKLRTIYYQNHKVCNPILISYKYN